MNIERSFTFAFKAPTATKKLILGGLLSMLFFTVFFFFVVTGYIMRILCDALEGRDAKLPEWNDLNALFHEGLQPVLLILACGSPLIFLSIFEQTVLAAIGPNISVFMIFIVLKLLASLMISIFLPLALIRLIVKGTLKAAFNFGQIVDFIKRNPANYFTAWSLCLIVGIAASIVGMFILFIGLFFTTFIANVISVHLFAQAYRASEPFKDDQEGKIRASMAVPPPLRG